MSYDTSCGTSYASSSDASRGGEGGELRLRFAGCGLAITLHHRMRGDVLERRVSLRDGGDTPWSRCARRTLPDREGRRLSRPHGRRPAESRLVTPHPPTGEQIMGSRRAHTGHQYLPRAALDTDATEGRGEAHGCALGRSGSWRIAVVQLPDVRVQITGGAGYDDSGLPLLTPGESYATLSLQGCPATAASASPRTSGPARTGGPPPSPWSCSRWTTAVSASVRAPRRAR